MSLRVAVSALHVVVAVRWLPEDAAAHLHPTAWPLQIRATLWASEEHLPQRRDARNEARGKRRRGGTDKHLS